MMSQVTVGLDGSPASTAAARWAADEAELRGASLDLVHAEEWLENPPLPVSTTEERRRWAEGVLRDTADELRREHPSLEISTRRVGGLPSLALASAAKNSDMLVLGSRGLGSIAGFLLGSNSSATIAETERPVVLVRSADPSGTPAVSDRAGGPVVAGVDIHQPCDRLLAFAFEEASHRDCPVIVVHGWSPPPILSYAPLLDPGVQSEMAHGIAQAMDEILNPWRGKFPSVRVEPRVTIGQAAIQILDAATGAALVIVGRRIRHSAYGTHIGPIAHAVMHHAASPVAVVAHE
ncbi:universal stress protein [Streptomyces sp. NBC_00347]|uniref:universal stress protein n=1 Tax=Streptomyces sp. NBC_00347 TaxID=2975721 RepID=UPI0022520CDE|nr:universal stress protein [Streptomyces sp. NBC_00347]MCX5126923.1 universal stress protein [Streptomyces sp. NBC_00347]